MALKAMHFTRQPPLDMLFYMQPYATNCTSLYPPSQAFLRSQGMKYSQSECKKSCLVHYVKGQQISKYETENIRNINFSQNTNELHYPVLYIRYVYVLTDFCCYTSQQCKSYIPSM